MSTNKLFYILLGVYLILVAFGLLFGLAVPAILTGIIALIAGILALLLVR